MNVHGVKSIYRFEMARWGRTLWQSLVTPVITTSLYFLVFGSAIGSRMSDMAGIPFGSFIVPGLILLSVLTQALMNASFGIFFPKFTGTIYEILSAPLSPIETAGRIRPDVPLTLIAGEKDVVAPPSLSRAAVV